MEYEQKNEPLKQLLNGNFKKKDYISSLNKIDGVEEDLRVLGIEN